MHVVAHQILAQAAYANAVLVMLAAILVRHVALDPACVELHQLALVRHPEPIVMPQAMSVNARPQLMRVVAHQILARVAYANVVLVMLVAILVRHVALDPACVEPHQLVLVRHRDPIVMRQTMSANVHPP